MAEITTCRAVDSGRSNLHNYVELFEMLESSDKQTVESVQALMLENLSATKDAWLLGVLVDYYIASQSANALDILVRIREPHDKHLFDKIVEYVKCDKVRYISLLLLSHLVHRQPSWLYKIASHRLFTSILSLLKTNTETPCLLCALFSVISLLPVIPSKVGPHLVDLFEIFSRLASWSTRKPIGVPEVYVLHLQVGVYTLFHRLYGMYPCNFLGYLRSYYGGREYNEDNLRVFTIAIKPMLERVRLHPLLVTACKETELSQKRWKRLAPHDILAECANISLDSIEGTPENIGWKSSFGVHQFTISPENSGQFQSLSSTVSLAVDSASVGSSNMKVDWTPSEVCQFETPPPLLQSEATNDAEVTEQSTTAECGQQKICEIVSVSTRRVDGTEICGDISEKTRNPISICEAMEAKEDLVDKEVSELTSMQSVPDNSGPSSRNDTPFCSTTQNLTDKSKIAVITFQSCTTKDRDDDSYEETDFHAQDSSDIKMETFVRTMNRLRYFSQCGLGSETTQNLVKKPVYQRSSSCPNINLCSLVTYKASSRDSKNSGVIQKPKVKNSAETIVITPSPQNPLWRPGPSNSVVDTSYEHLLPLYVQPVRPSATVEKTVQNKVTDFLPFFCSLSPAELLDRHLQMGTDSHLSQLYSIPITSSKNANWTHFGGKAPEDEVAMLQAQILLLHNQLMFERHRREMHSERNRRLLGKAKQAQVHEEYIIALKDQVQLLEKENDVLEAQLKEQSYSLNQLQQDMKKTESEADFNLRKLMQENSNMSYANKQLQGLLVAQKQENDKIREENKKSESKLLDQQFQLEVLRHKLSKMKALEKELAHVSKENIMLQELNQQYEEKLRLQVENMPDLPNIEAELLKETAVAEIAALKEMLQIKNRLLDAAVAKTVNLEEECANLHRKLTEQIEFCQNVSAIHRDEMKALEDRLIELQNINAHHSTHILQMYHQQDMLESELKSKTKFSYDKEPSLASQVFESQCASSSSAASTVSHLAVKVTAVSSASDVQPIQS